MTAAWQLLLELRGIMVTGSVGPAGRAPELFSFRFSPLDISGVGESAANLYGPQVSADAPHQETMAEALYAGCATLAIILRPAVAISEYAAAQRHLHGHMPQAAALSRLPSSGSHAIVADSNMQRIQCPGQISHHRRERVCGGFCPPGNVDRLWEEIVPVATRPRGTRCCGARWRSCNWPANHYHADDPFLTTSPAVNSN